MVENPPGFGIGGKQAIPDGGLIDDREDGRGVGSEDVHEVGVERRS